MDRAEIVIHKLERPKEAEVLFVHFISICGLRGFAKTGKRCSLEDDPQSAELIRKLYRRMNRPELCEPTEVACMWAFVNSTFGKHRILKEYGKGSGVALVLQNDALLESKRVMVFNGDVKNLAKDLDDRCIEPCDVWITPFEDDQALANELKKLSGPSSSNTRLRLHGAASEARLFCPIKPELIHKIWIEHSDDDEAMNLAKAIARLRDGQH